MKEMKILNALLMLFLALAGCFTFCTNTIDNDADMDSGIVLNSGLLKDAEEALLGKWELVRLYDGTIDIKHTPTGYVEYLPEGRFGWYDYSTKEYTLYEGKYWLDEYWDEASKHKYNEDGWVLHYENSLIFNEKFGGNLFLYDYYLPERDKPYGNNFPLRFINKDTMTLSCIDLYSIVRMPDYFYKRKK